MRELNGSTIAKNSSARHALMRGIDVVADLVQSTMGPMGKNIIIERSMRYPLVTKDGVTVANNINLKEPAESIGAELCKQAAENTNMTAGDGTTTAVVLTRGLVKEGVRMIEAGFCPMRIKDGMNLAVATAIAELKSLSLPADSYERIFYAAAISAKEAALGDLIAKAMDQVGTDGIIMVRESLEQRTSVEISPGMELGQGYLSPNFITKGQRMVVELNDVYILLTDSIISDAALMEKIIKWCTFDQKSLLVVAKGLVRDALGVLIDANRAGRIKAVAIEAPEAGDLRMQILDDLGVATGGQLVSEQLGSSLAAAKKAVLGTAKKVTVTRNKTVITEGGGESAAVAARIRQLKAMQQQEKELAAQEMLQKRIARLAGGVAVIRVGGTTRTAMTEQKYRVEDAVNAAEAAVKHGILPGGGTALIRAAQAVRLLHDDDEDVQAGISIVAKSLQLPLCQIVKNARGDVNHVLKNVEKAEGWQGYDALKGELTDLLAAGIVDPTLVTVTALRNAVSVASMVLTTEALVAEPTYKFDTSLYSPEILEEAEMRQQLMERG